MLNPWFIARIRLMSCSLMFSAASNWGGVHSSQLQCRQGKISGSAAVNWNRMNWAKKNQRPLDSKQEHQFMWSINHRFRSIMINFTPPFFLTKSDKQIGWLVGGLVAIFYFPIYWVSNHPNGRTHIFQRGGWTINQSGLTPLSCEQTPDEISGIPRSSRLSG